MGFYAVIDTNVLVSALLSSREDAATVQVIARMLAGEITPVYSGAILAEYREVLRRKKFGFLPNIVNHLLDAVTRFGLLVEPTPTGAILPDMEDLPFYEVVHEKREDGAYLVTGNIKHFPREPFIVTQGRRWNCWMAKLPGNNNRVQRRQVWSCFLKLAGTVPIDSCL